MPAPYDYSSVLSPVDPGQAIMQGVLQGEQLLRNQQQYQQQQQEYQRAQQQRVVAEERKAQFDAELEDLAESRDPRDITGLLLQFPEQAQILKGISERLSKEEIDVMLGDYNAVMGFYESGRSDLVEGFYEEKIELYENSGRQEEAANTKNVLEMFKSDPKGWAVSLSLPAAAYDQTGFLDAIDKRRQAQIDFRKAQVEARKEEAPTRKALRDLDILGAPLKPTDADKFSNGLTMYRTDLGEQYGIDVNNNILQGAEYATALDVARDFEAAAIGQKAGSRARGGLEVELELQPKLSELVARATKRGEISQKLAKESFDTLVKARRNIGNLDAAIAAVDAGASSGVIQSKFPSWKASSIELRNIQRQLGLDVIGAVTFGALSKGELDLALATALDLDLDTPALKDLLERKKAAQIKMIAELEKATMYFSAGGNLGDYVQLQQSYEVPTGAQEPIGRSSDSVDEVIITVTTQADFDQLPSGTRYREADGNIYRKP